MAKVKYKTIKEEEPQVVNELYSDKLLRLRSMSKNRLTTEDISQDERLAYIINK